MVQSDDVEVTFEETKNVELNQTRLKAATTGACAAYLAGAANVATGTATVANGRAVSTGSVGRANKFDHDV